MRNKDIIEHANAIKDYCKSKQNCKCCIFYNEESEHITRICQLTAKLAPEKWEFKIEEPTICDYCEYKINNWGIPCYDCPAKLRKDLENE